MVKRKTLHPSKVLWNRALWIKKVNSSYKTDFTKHAISLSKAKKSDNKDGFEEPE